MNHGSQFSFEKITPQRDKMSTDSTRLASLPLGDDGHLTKPGNPVGQSGVGAEKGCHRASAKERPNNAESRSGRRNGGRGDTLIVCAEFFERVNQSVGIAH